MAKPQEAIPNTGTEVTKRKRSLRAVGNSLISLTLKHGPEKVVEDIALRRIFGSPRFEVRLQSENDDIGQALALEQKVWTEENYGDLTVYEKYLPQSRIYAAFDGDRCVGMNRLFSGSPELPPFISKMKIEDPKIKAELIKSCADLKVEEFGTVAIERELRNGRVFPDLCRLAYRDATERGIQTWGVIMEPDRVQKMNRYLGFTFKQVGPATTYQGGECASHIMDFDEVREQMSSKKPKLYEWFVNEPLEV